MPVPWLFRFSSFGDDTSGTSASGDFARLLRVQAMAWRGSGYSLNLDQGFR